jgi:secondary thiamine-phosphate synthase enzyme
MNNRMTDYDMVQQIEITLTPKRRGFHLVTNEIMRQLPQLPKTGIINIFCKHTSCGLSINENADPDVRVDMETIFNRIVPENRPEYEHTLEGADDMPAHAKSTLSGVSLTIPITNGRLNMGTWQGIYFCEYCTARSDYHPSCQTQPFRRESGDHVILALR